MDNAKPPFRAGFVAIIGGPNVGKSTLMNNLLQQKLSIVTSKPQTTRHRILGILSAENYQMVFYDTPGLLKPKYLLHEAMIEFARTAIDDADLVLLMVDATNPGVEHGDTNNPVTKALKRVNKPVYLLINKIDLVKKGRLLPAMESYSKQYPFKEIIPISALTLEGVDAVREMLVQALPEHQPYFPPDVVSDQSERFFCAEMVREKIFENFRQEIPYSTTVEIVEFKERQGQKDFISAEIYVERDSQKGILIGRNGEALREIGELARRDIEEFLARPVYLELHVKVREGWRNDKTWLKRLGYTADHA